MKIFEKSDVFLAYLVPYMRNLRKPNMCQYTMGCICQLWDRLIEYKGVRCGDFVHTH